MVASTDLSTVVAYRIVSCPLHDGTTLYAVALIYGDGQEWGIGRMCRTSEGARKQRVIADAIAALPEVTA